MTVEGQQGLFLLDESPNCDTADVDVEWNMIDISVVECGTIKPCLVGGGMEEPYRVGQVLSIPQQPQVGGNRAELDIVRVRRQRSVTLLG